MPIFQLQPIFITVKQKAHVSSIFSLLSLVVCVFVLSSCSDNLTPTNVVDKYLQNEANANFAANYDLLTADSQLKIGRNEYAARLNQARQAEGIVSIQIVTIDKSPPVLAKRATVPYHLEITLQSGQKLTQFGSMVLLQQEDGWRVVWPPQ